MWYVPFYRKVGWTLSRQYMYSCDQEVVTSYIVDLFMARCAR